ncbi:glucose dehydrogenase [Halobacteriales archaeon QS_1_68_20]|nr:MAG: glucose dehydrogenase [Halobacteriales archaeon QS_1_68_20]
MARRRRREPPSILKHYPRMLAAYLRRGEDGLSEIEEDLRSRAAAQPEGKFTKRQAAYVPFVPLPPLEWRHKCGHCRFWVDEGPGEAGQCMIVGTEDDGWGGESIHEEAGCALFMPPAGEPAFEWLREQRDPTGADLVRGEYHAPRSRGVEIPITDVGGGAAGRRPDDAHRRPDEAHRRHAGKPDVGTAVAPAGRTVRLERVAGGMAAPVDLAFDPVGDRIFVADQAGLVHVVGDGDLRDEPLLDLRERTVELRNQYDERGVLGMALHPDFAENGRLFVRYSAPRRGGTPADYDHTEVLAEFRVDDDRSPVDPGDERALMEIPHPKFNHNAGAVAFGPDGYLCLAMGDGGGEADSGFGHVPGGNAQDVTRNVLGSIMRVDVDADVDEPPEWNGDESDDPRGEEPYGVPGDNPLVGDSGFHGVGENGVDELYAWGLRNPWRMSFDSEGRLFVADVGQHLYEEVNIVEKGGNYGWPIREGYHCLNPDNPSDPLPDCPEQSRRGEPLLDPILEYPHVHDETVIGSAIVGGAVYEGEAVPELQGAYVFGEWATSQDKPSGRLFAVDPPTGWGDSRSDDDWTVEELAVANTDNGRPNRNVLGFGRGPEGELYVLSSETHAPAGQTGAIHRIAPPE